MREVVSWHVELLIKDGELETFRRLTNEMVEWTRREEGVIDYLRYIHEPANTVHIFERYIDSAAAVDHLVAFDAQFGGRFQGLVERKRFAVYGSASPELRDQLDRYGAEYFSEFAGFSCVC